MFFTNKNDVPENVDTEKNIIMIAEREIECEVLKRVVREY